MFSPSSFGFRRRIVVAIALVLLVSPSPVRAQAREYDVKAAFVYNFVNFVTWPASAFSTPSEPLRVCITDPDPFGPGLDEVMRGETVNSRPIEVTRVRDAAAVAQCQVVFISRGSTHVDEILRTSENRPILTIGETDDFLKRGGLVRFVVDGGRVRFDVNQAAATARGLVLSSKLLRVARNTTLPPT